MEEPSLLDEDETTPPEAQAREDGGPDGSGAVLPRAVLEALPTRDPAALAAFFDAYFDRVYGYVRRLVRDEHLAEDLTQDVFLHVHRAFPTYDPARALRPWVFTIATNKVRDFWRSRRHRDSKSEVSVEREGGVLEISRPGRPEDSLEEEEFDRQLRDAVDELPEGMRVTVALRVFEGLSFEAIGGVLERSEVAVRKRYSRALEVLRARLGGAWRVHSEGAE